MTEQCPLMAGQDIPGARWIASSRADRARWWAMVREHFEVITPPNLIEWVEGPMRRTEFDEAARRVRLRIEGVALVPDVVGHPVGPGTP
jgi:hypothetical protein